MRSWMSVGCVLAGGCVVFDAIEGAFEPIVVVGIVSRVEPPDALPAEVEVPEMLVGGLAGTLLLADAGLITDLDKAPVTNADVRIVGCGTSAGFDEAGSGAYVLQPGSAVEGCDTSSFELERVDVEPDANMAITIPPSPVGLSVPTEWITGRNLKLDLDQSGWDTAIVTVVDLQNGAITYSNEPRTAREWYDFLTGDDDLGSFVVSDRAFPHDGLYALAVTGIQLADRNAFDEVNILLSTVGGGRTLTFAVQARPE